MEDEPRLIKKYSNRKLYDTSSRRYITLERIGVLIREGENVQVIDRASGEDLTAVTLSQVVLDSERKKHGAIPEALLQQLVRNPSEAFSEAVRQTVSAGQDLIQKAETRVVREPQQALAEARKTLQGLKIPQQKDMERLERRVRELTARVEQMAEVIERLDPGAKVAAARSRRRSPARKGSTPRSARRPKAG
ncbi:MAG TPA: polyhydroxyalkanoate synthesis regulator DNA-binding domain-containing protein [Candidatus Dormibacteraeota bacterium]|jgi:polyhydroxyalkanoate synthesis repressor PhaR|nr:polyhydroxyalkanoate synthesis regulator DNA-binding domain-containing protein [Candidatus Dormibacteraeota bacterium]